MLNAPGTSKGSQGAERLYFDLRQVLRVKGCLAGSAAEKALQQGDMILAINGEPVTCYRDVETACTGLEGSGRETLSLTLLRQVGCKSMIRTFESGDIQLAHMTDW